MPPDAYRPFGTGLRACIGRQFALQEATLVLGMLLQRFEFIDHRNYQLHTQSTLTVKPADLWIKLRPRADRPPVHRKQVTVGDPAPVAEAAPAPGRDRPRHPAARCCSGRTWARPRASPTGSAARAWTAATRSPSPRSTTTAPTCPAQGAVLIVCSSYNGEPPENAGNTNDEAGLGRQQGPGHALDVNKGRVSVQWGADSGWARQRRMTYCAMSRLMIQPSHWP